MAGIHDGSFFLRSRLTPGLSEFQSVALDRSVRPLPRFPPAPPLLRHNRRMARITQLEVNGAKRRIDADADRSLLSVLRDDLDLTGTKYGCGEGQCAACTVLVEGQPTKSCLTKVGAVADKRILTIEGLAPEGKLHPVQEAFLEAGAMQCGWCTPGMILGAVGLLHRNA